MGATILVVDDDPGIAGLISMMLKRAGYTTVLAHSGQQALDKHATMDLDLILLDLAMPGMDGYAVLEAIRQREKAPEVPRIPIILLTAHVRSAFQDSDLFQQVDGIITKPVTAQRLQDELAKILGKDA